MIEHTDAQDETCGVVVPIPTRDRLPDLRQYIDGDRGDYVSKGVRVVPVDLLRWLETEVRYQRSMSKRYREMDEAS